MNEATPLRGDGGLWVWMAGLRHSRPTGSGVLEAPPDRPLLFDRTASTMMQPRPGSTSRSSHKTSRRREGRLKETKNTQNNLKPD